ncbi:hypothetical protein GW17_00000257 [Ensete ventricosum]|nr:hypothetical protein GW17_00000257 [Ensete ventricosum]
MDSGCGSSTTRFRVRICQIYPSLTALPITRFLEATTSKESPQEPTLFQAIRRKPTENINPIKNRWYQSESGRKTAPPVRGQWRGDMRGRRNSMGCGRRDRRRGGDAALPAAVNESPLLAGAARSTRFPLLALGPLGPGLIDGHKSRPHVFLQSKQRPQPKQKRVRSKPPIPTASNPKQSTEAIQFNKEGRYRTTNPLLVERRET